MICMADFFPRVSRAAELPQLLSQLAEKYASLENPAVTARVLELAGSDAGLAETWLQRYQVLDRAPPARELLSQLAAGDADEAPGFLELWCSLRQKLAPDLLPQLLDWCRQLAGLHSGYVNLLLENLEHLPLHRPQLIDAWLQDGLPMLERSFAAGAAWLGLESVTSLETLQKYTGRVEFWQVQRRFELYAMAMLGRPIGFDIQHDCQPGICSLAGGRLQLSAVLAERPHFAGNLALYKLAILHQLAVFEAGTFSFRLGQSADPLGDYLASFACPELAARLFRLVEDTRLDAFLVHHYAGIAPLMKQAEQEAQRALPETQAGTSQALMVDLVRISLGAELSGLAEASAPAAGILLEIKKPGASVADTAGVVNRLYPLLLQASPAADPDLKPEESILHRGRLSLAELARELQLEVRAEEEPGEDAREKGGLSFALDPRGAEPKHSSRGQVQKEQSEFVTRLPADAKVQESEDEKGAGLQLDEAQQSSLADDKSKAFFYAEWDHLAGDYRQNWCRLLEQELADAGPGLVRNILQDHRSLAADIKRQLLALPPQLPRRVKGRYDGEELDIEALVAAVCDRRSGQTPDERIYVEKRRRERDPATLFLLDMSASTDEKLEPARLPGAADEDADEDWPRVQEPAAAARRIIDIEREAVVLMAEALEALGDRYAICGFSGYGRDQVEFFVGKRFSEPWSLVTKGRLASIRPCRSTRMGPAIRHAAALLAATRARTQNLIIVSDGYPQDHDYGPDRNSRTYGLMDTARALRELRACGIQAFCLTVDPAGYDYLRELCPDRQYMVIQQLAQLPAELARVYCSLAA